MNREEVIKYIKTKYKDKPYYLWNKYPLYAVFKHKNDKWYGIIMNVRKDKLDLEGNDEIDILVLKYYKELIGDIRKNKGILKAYHMNKENWITILLDGSVEKEKIKQLIDISFDLTE